jgi:putative redox protein
VVIDPTSPATPGGDLPKDDGSGRPPSRVAVTWAGGHAFEVGRPGGPTVRLDAAAGPSPVDALLGALAACTAVDVVDILAKRRTPLAALAVDVEGERFGGTPGRVTRVVLVYRMRGAGVERAHAERAVELAVTKYCSVRDSLDPAIPVEWRVELEGEA